MTFSYIKLSKTLYKVFLDDKAVGYGEFYLELTPDSYPKSTGTVEFTGKDPEYYEPLIAALAKSIYLPTAEEKRVLTKIESNPNHTAKHQIVDVGDEEHSSTVCIDCSPH